MRIKNIEDNFLRGKCASAWNMYNIDLYKFYFDINFRLNLAIFNFYIIYILQTEEVALIQNSIYIKLCFL